VLRAITGATLYINGTTPNLTTAAICCGPNTVYVTAAVILLRSENTALQEQVLRGHVPLLSAAAQVRRIADLVTAYRAAKDADRIAFARACGTDQILDVLATASDEAAEKLPPASTLRERWERTHDISEYA
jgi:hypothetical protein